MPWLKCLGGGEFRLTLGVLFCCLANQACSVSTQSTKVVPTQDTKAAQLSEIAKLQAELHDLTAPTPAPNDGAESMWRKQVQAMFVKAPFSSPPAATASPTNLAAVTPAPTPADRVDWIKVPVPGWMDAPLAAHAGKGMV